jgi:hypothetical protein
MVGRWGFIVSRWQERVYGVARDFLTELRTKKTTQQGGVVAF